jgi:hypothetical protein
MNDHPASLFKVEYRMERGDYMALSAMLTRRPASRVAIELAIYVAALLAIAFITAGFSFDRMLGAIGGLFALPSGFLWVPLVLAGPVLLLSTPTLTGLIAALIYKRNAIADRDIVLHLTAQGIEGGSSDLYFRIGWAAVNRLVETPKHLFIQISPREALIIPRRAIPNEDTYRNLAGFIRARTGLSSK